MQLALRPYVTTGMAMVGATAIIASPISPSAPQDINVPAIYSSEVALTAGFDPITPWVTFFEKASANVGVIGQALLAQPAPILSQFAANQLGYIQASLAILQSSATAAVGWAASVPAQIQVGIDYLRAGDYRRGVLALWTIPNQLIVSAGFPLMGLLDTFTAVSQNFANVVATLPLIARYLGQNALNVYTSFGQVGRFVLDPLADAVEAGDIGAAIGIIINAPAVMADFIINRSVLGPTGFVYNLLVTVPRLIAAAITPPAPPAPEVVNTVTSLPSAGAQMVSLNAESTAAIGGAGTVTSPATESPATETPLEETPAAETPLEETPAAETPVEEAPVEATPVEEVPVDEAPVDDDTTGSGDGDTDLGGDDDVTPGETDSDTEESDSDSTDTDTPDSTSDDDSAPSGAHSGAATGGSDSSGSTNSGGDSSGSDSSGGSGSGAGDE